MSPDEHGGFTPPDEDLKLPPQEPPQEKTNPTPDLSDEQYMEQLFLIAQSIAVMPGQRDGMPNVSTPPPIRARWAAFMLSLGLRIDPRLATHRLVNQAGPAAGNWGPKERVTVSTPRSSMKRADMMEVWERMNPETFEAVKNGSMSREDLLSSMPADMQQAAFMAQRVREQEQREAQDRAAREARQDKG